MQGFLSQSLCRLTKSFLRVCGKWTVVRVRALASPTASLWPLLHLPLIFMQLLSPSSFSTDPGTTYKADRFT